MLLLLPVLLLLLLLPIVTHSIGDAPHQRYPAIRARVLLQGGKFRLDVLNQTATHHTDEMWWEWGSDEGAAVSDHRRLKAYHAEDTDGGLPVVAAKAEYSEDTYHPSGFGTFRVSTNRRLLDDTQAYAAGYAEGALTSTRIFHNYLNMRCQVNCTGAVPEPIAEFFATQLQWTKEQVKANPECHFWKAVSSVLAQFDGMLDGYNEYTKEERLDRWALDLINGLGDLFDIKPAVLKHERPDFDSMDHSGLHEYLSTHVHCSALVKVSADLSDILVGHSSWFSYSSMLRIFKVYEIHLRNPRVSSRRVAFSSYPGMLVSLDDFYMMGDSGLAMVQTTNPTLNASLWDLVHPDSLLAWQRVKVANMLATDGQDWLKWVSKHNSGTYNNQYMVIAFNKFKPKQALPRGTLWAIEQIPGKVVGADVTNELERSYWPSFNIPYFRDIYVDSGFPRLDRHSRRTVGSEYEMAPRAQIFRRDHGVVEHIDALKRILRYNDYKNDPLSDSNPYNSICARGDLADRPRAGGCYDTKMHTSQRPVCMKAKESCECGRCNAHGGKVQKMGGAQCVTNAKLFKEFKAWVINGPTAQGQPVFEWSSSVEDVASVPHYGQPNSFDFEFELMRL